MVPPADEEERCVRTFRFINQIKGGFIIEQFTQHLTIPYRMSKKQLVDSSPYRLIKSTYSWVECVYPACLFMVSRVPSAVLEVRRLYRQKFLANLVFGMRTG
jgi:hypothetical protein